ncbi:MAG: trehalose-phosphatase [Gordonia sp. (in: high G+C Gram-positive bacteria)]|uniref:trehalose-phosphatase n=1 Tax=Gordonia sp. (in: high G+C Gram-positive bacteria) TaxID=84139 RepID=UPI0039E4A45B
MTALPAELTAALRAFAALPTVVVASDFDGCLAPIVAHPADARPDPAAVAALVDLAALPATTTAVVSGRARADLAALAGLPVDSPVTLIGSHGSEFDDGFATPITDDQRALLAAVADDLAAISTRFPGSMVETKPASAVLHVRNVPDPDKAAAALDEARRGPAARTGVHATEGKAVLELAVIETGKGHALDLLRARTDADAVCYLGDDVTDEHAFGHLTAAADVAIKVGDGATIAHHRIAGPELVGDVLRTILMARTDAH